jgi:hypothetical protein
MLGVETQEALGEFFWGCADGAAVVGSRYAPDFCVVWAGLQDAFGVARGDVVIVRSMD